jgi:TDG/mug DNA glycosylase family protein
VNPSCGQSGELGTEFVVDIAQLELRRTDFDVEQRPIRMRHGSMLARSFSLDPMGFTRAELLAFENATVPDLVGPGVKLLFVGINPGLWTAATQTHFAHPGNRFYPALLRAGVIEREIDRGSGMSDEDRADLIERGIGITNVVHRATAKASALSAEELRDGGAQLRRRVAELGPAVVAVAGVTAYRSAFRLPKAQMGRQEDLFEGAELWVVPNPSGLNAHETTESLAAAYRAPAVAASIVSTGSI